MVTHYKIHKGIRKSYKLRRLAPVLMLAVIASVGVNSQINHARQNTALSKSWSLNDGQAQAQEIPPIKLALPWPSYGYSAYVVPKDNILASSDSDIKPVPIASLAKIITALAVLDKYPLKAGEQGPMITLSSTDEALYSEYVSKNGTVLPVNKGERISQYQLLQGVLLRSSNNMADSLAIWAFGSMEEYTDYANKILKDLGMNNTFVSDASGYSPKTVGTAEDMARLGYLYMQNPVLREIAMQTQAKLPVAGIVSSFNSFSNNKEIIGIKIGNTDEAGKCFIVASIRKPSGKPEELSVAAVLGATSYITAAKDAKTILKAGNQAHDRLAR